MTHSRRILEVRAWQVYKEYSVPISMEHIIERDYGLTLEYQILSKNLSILGQTVFEDGYVPIYSMDTAAEAFLQVKAGTIMVDTRLSDEKEYLGRYQFTLAHELAHWILHRDVYGCGNNVAATNGGDILLPILERQADYLAAAILMPLREIKHYYYLQNGPLWEKIARLSDIFMVSKEAMKNRIRELGLCVA